MAAISVAPVCWLSLHLVPLPPALHAPPASSREFTDRHGATLREVRIEDRFAREVAFQDIPLALRQAMLAAEDKRFFAHRGVDCLAIGRRSG